MSMCVLPREESTDKLQSPYAFAHGAILEVHMPLIAEVHLYDQMDSMDQMSARLCFGLFHGCSSFG